MRRYMINFFKSVDLYDEQTFNEITKNTIIVKKRYDEIKDFVGCYYCKPNGTVKIILPELSTFQDILIHIHEYTHAITRSEDEILPTMLETLFVKKYFDSTEILDDVVKYTEEEIKKSVSDKHTFAKKLKLQFLKNSI